MISGYPVSYIMRSDIVFAAIIPDRPIKAILAGNKPILHQGFSVILGRMTMTSITEKPIGVEVRYFEDHFLSRWLINPSITHKRQKPIMRRPIMAVPQRMLSRLIIT